MKNNFDNIKIRAISMITTPKALVELAKNKSIKVKFKGRK
jgi:hypothetical protein